MINQDRIYQICFEQKTSSDLHTSHCPTSNHTAVLLEGKVYIGGGNEGPSSPSYRVDVYDVANNCWDPSSITTAYCDFAMTSLNERLIIAGGRDKCQKVTNLVFSVDGSELKNYTKMITPRALATAAGYQRTLIITGGERDCSKRCPLLSCLIVPLDSGTLPITFH